VAGAPLHTRRPVLAGVLRQLPMTVVLLVVIAGLLAVTAGNWRAGLVLMGVGLLTAGVARMVLPVRRVGFLAVRSQTTDVVLTLGAGLVLVATAVAIPSV